MCANCLMHNFSRTHVHVHVHVDLHVRTGICICMDCYVIVFVLERRSRHLL